MSLAIFHIECVWCTPLCLYYLPKNMNWFLVYFQTVGMACNLPGGRCFVSNNIWKFTNHLKQDNCILLGYYAACSGNSLPTFRDNLSVPPSKFKNSFLNFLTLEYERVIFPRNCHSEDRVSWYILIIGANVCMYTNFTISAEPIAFSKKTFTILNFSYNI